MYSLLFLSTPSPRTSSSFASAEWGLSHVVPPVGSPREHRRAWPLGILSLWGTGLATHFLWPRPPLTCSAGSHPLGTPAGRLSRAPCNLGGLPRRVGGL